VRTKNWAPGEWEAPGQFVLKVNGRALDNTLGLTAGWSWEYAGEAHITSKTIKLELVDLTGFNGRADAIYFSTVDEAPPRGLKELAEWRTTVSNEASVPAQIEEYDLVVVGGGIAGCASAIAAAEQGLKVALIHDRPVLGGNASSEIRVHTLGIYGHFERILRMLDTKHYPNGSPEAYAEDQKRHRYMARYENIHLFLNWRAYGVETKQNTVQAVDAAHTHTGERIRFVAPYFADCTGDG